MTGATGARESVLGRIAEALADGPAPIAVPRDYAMAAADGAEVVALFAERVSDYRATVHEASASSLLRVVATVLAGHGVRRLAVPAGIPDKWLEATTVVRVPDDPPLTWDELDAIVGGVAGYAVANAETVKLGGRRVVNQKRRALSLLPDLHVCVVSADRIVGSVPEALARLDPTRPLTWISGPSATSDIELQRVEGVHGPRRLDVIIVSAG